MRSRKVLTIAGFLVVWSFVTYYFLLRNNPVYGLQHRQRVAQRLQQLENEAHGEYKRSERLMQNVMSILKVKYVTDATEDTIDRNTPLMPQTTTPRATMDIIPMPKELLEGGLQQQMPNESKSQRNELNKMASTSTTTTAAAAAVAASAAATAPVLALPKLTQLPNGQPVIPIVVFACNRVSISKCLDNLLQYRPDAEQFPIIVSQDCGDEATKKIILSYVTKSENVRLIEQPDQTDIFVPPKEKKFKGYYKIARHYGWALNTTFQNGYDFVVIVEDDLNVAPDFYEYFSGTHSLLKNDSSLWCVSAWNDNGKANFIDVSRPELLYRTDFFPGLGWMLTKELWRELSVKWPKSFWDDWIRHPEQRKGRVCIRPEISRTKTFGKVGVSNGLFFDKYLKHIKLSEDFVEFTKLNLSYLLKANYDRKFLGEVYTYPIVTHDELRRSLIRTDGPVRIQYTTKEQYKRTTKMLGLMDDFKSGVPRTAYHGIVPFFYNKRRVYLAPNANWKGYELSWS